MAKIGFSMLPEPGHLNPSFKLSKALKLRGHEIYYFAPARAENYIRAQGFRFVPLPNTFYLQMSRIHGAGHSPDETDALKTEDHIYLEEGKIKISSACPNDREQVLARAEQAMEEVRSRLQEIQLDLLIIDPFLFVIHFIAKRKGARTLLLSTGLLLPIYQNEEDDSSNSEYALPIIFLCPQEFARPHSIPKHLQCFYMEPSIDLQRKEVDFPWDRIDEEKPLIYCSMGSQIHRYSGAGDLLRKVIDAHWARPEWQLVMSIGDHFRIDDFPSIPPNVLLVNRAPQLKLLRRASMMITHGGLGTVKECILFGVPMIVFPFDTDQPLNAARIRYHGLGVSGNPQNTSVEQINSFIDRIANEPSFKTRTKAMGARFQELEHSGTGARIVEQVLRSN